MFDPKGLLNGGRPNNWREWPRGQSYHHMIPKERLGKVWNRMTEIGMTDHRRLFLNQVAANAPQGNSLPVDNFLTDASRGRAVDNRFDLIATAIIWQGFNLAQGPSPSMRDPKKPIAFAEPGNGEFDRLVVLPKHIDRIQRLSKIDYSMSKFLLLSDSGTVPHVVDIELGLAFESLESINHLDYIPQQDVNWYGLPRETWVQLSDDDRKKYDEYMQDSKLAKDGNELDRSQTLEYAEAVIEYLGETGEIITPSKN